MPLADFFSSALEAVLPSVYAEEQQDAGADAAQDDAGANDGGDDDAPAEGADDEEEEEEEEPEDVSLPFLRTAPGIREECEQTKCKTFKHHYEECAARISAGKTQIEGETCVEELFHLMHCVDECAAPKVFATLK
ncbi:ubiquinol--cytochrome-c reductase subunit 6 [Microbotryomycetes sp. JL201]|nr:ubiquinol--cytochrome-c reductase subunit 6 [Microbotryomycetes sp. JL201]